MGLKLLLWIPCFWEGCDDPLEPAYEDAVQTAEPQDTSSIAANESTGNDLKAASVTDRVVPNQVTRVLPQFPGHSELSRMEKGAQWEVDDELVTDHGQLMAQGYNPLQTVGPSMAMEGDREDHTGQTGRFAEGTTGQKTRQENSTSALLGAAESDAVQRAMLSHVITEQERNRVQSQMVPLFHQMLNRLELMEKRQVRLD